MATNRKAEVVWQGDLMNGSGTIQQVTSGALGPLEVSWASRSEEPNGRTSPSTSTNQPPLEIGSRSVKSAGPTLKIITAKPIATRNANASAQRPISAGSASPSASSWAA